MLKRLTSLTVLIAFVATSVYSPSRAYGAPLLGLPEPGTMVSLSSAYQPALIKGITLDPKNPFLFDFIIDTGDDKTLSSSGDTNLAGLSGETPNQPTRLVTAQEQLKAESTKLIKYFLAALTIPEKDLWVNLSPYEKDRMLPQNLSQTEMGRDMLAQDYLLKQITASLIYPEKDLGKSFWDKVYAKSQALYGTTQIPVNTFNKVWIVADKADVFERNQTAFVMNAHLKVMLEEDYLALDKSSVIASPKGEAISKGTTSTIASQIIRDIIIPELEKEVNEGKNFAPLRQMFHSMILASWFKLALKDAVMTQLYGNQGKVGVGVTVDDKQAAQKIYDRYVQAYKKGVFNYIKEDNVIASPKGEAISNGTTIPRKYFSGGVAAFDPAMIRRNTTLDAAREVSLGMTPGGVFNVSAAMRSQVPGSHREMDHPTKLSIADQYYLDLVAALEADLDSGNKTTWQEMLAWASTRNFIYLMKQKDTSASVAVTALSKLIEDVEATKGKSKFSRNMTLTPLIDIWNDRAVYQAWLKPPAGKAVAASEAMLNTSQASLFSMRLDSLREKFADIKQQTRQQEKSLSGDALAAALNALKKMMNGLEGKGDVSERNAFTILKAEIDQFITANSSAQSQPATLGGQITAAMVADLTEVRAERVETHSVSAQDAEGVGATVFLQSVGGSTQFLNSADTSFTKVLRDGPGRILASVNSLGSNNGLILTELEREGISALVEVMRELYEGMEKATGGDLQREHYHNHMHNVAVTLGLIRLAQSLKVIPNLYEIKGDAKKEALRKGGLQLLRTVFLAPLLHDFHVRDAQYNGLGTPAFVQETMVQLRDLLGLEQYEAPKEGDPRQGFIAYAKYTAKYMTLKEWQEQVAKLKTGETLKLSKVDLERFNRRKDFHQALLKFFGLEKSSGGALESYFARIETSTAANGDTTIFLRKAMEEAAADPDVLLQAEIKAIFADIEALIRRTDFPSNVAPIPAPFNGMVINLRSWIEDEVASLKMRDDAKMDTKDLEGILADLEIKFADIIASVNAKGETDATRAIVKSIQRVKFIETEYLKALLKVEPKKRFMVHQLAMALEKGSDQSVSAWLGSVELTERITLGLSQEIPLVSKQGNYMFFYKPQLLTPGVLEILRKLPLASRVRFLRIMNYFADYGTDYILALEMIRDQQALPKSADETMRKVYGEVVAELSLALDPSKVDMSAELNRKATEKLKLIPPFVQGALKNSKQDWKNLRPFVLKALGIYENSDGSFVQLYVNDVLKERLAKTVYEQNRLRIDAWQKLNDRLLERKIRALKLPINQEAWVLVKEGGIDKIVSQKDAQAKGHWLVVSDNGKGIFIDHSRTDFEAAPWGMKKYAYQSADDLGFFITSTELEGIPHTSVLSNLEDLLIHGIPEDLNFAGSGKAEINGLITIHASRRMWNQPSKEDDKPFLEISKESQQKLIKAVIEALKNRGESILLKRNEDTRTRNTQDYFELSYPVLPDVGIRAYTVSGFKDSIVAGIVYKNIVYADKQFKKSVINKLRDELSNAPDVTAAGEVLKQFIEKNKLKSMGLDLGNSERDEDAAMTVDRLTLQNVQNVLEKLAREVVFAETLTDRLRNVWNFSVESVTAITSMDGIPDNLLVVGPQEVHTLSREELGALVTNKNNMVSRVKLTEKANGRSVDFLVVIPRGSAEDIAQEALRDAVRNYQMYAGTVTSIDDRMGGYSLQAQTDGTRERDRENAVKNRDEWQGAVSWRAMVLQVLGQPLDQQVQTIIKGTMNVLPKPAQSVKYSLNHGGQVSTISVTIPASAQVRDILPLTKDKSLGFGFEKYPNVLPRELVRLRVAVAGLSVNNGDIKEATSAAMAARKSEDDDQRLSLEILEMFRQHERAGVARYNQKKLWEQASKKPLQLRFYSGKGRTDAAMLRGGIDFDANKMGMKVSKEGKGVDITFDPAMVERMKRDGFDGFVPVIINITPVVSILPLLGLAPRREEEEQKLAGV